MINLLLLITNKPVKLKTFFSPIFGAGAIALSIFITSRP